MTDDTEPAQQTITLNADVLSALRTLASLITEARP